MPVFQPAAGLPGFSSERIAGHRTVWADAYTNYLPGGVTFDGAKMRDPDNPDYNASTNPLGQYRLRAGLLIGKVTANSKWANSVLGTLNGALTGASTTVTFASAAQVTELVRRVGATGTFKVTGPPTAGGTVRTLTATYSGTSSTTATVTALGVSYQEDVRLSPAATGGNLQLTVMKADGTFVTTANIAWNATDATYLAAINSALDTATGAAGSIVASAISATDPDLGFTLTYATATYAGVTITPAKVALLPTTSNDWYVVPRTAGVDGRFVTGSLVQPTDGSETVRGFLPTGWELYMPEDSTDRYFSHVPTAGKVDGSNLLPWPADTALRQWVRDQLNAYGQFVFTEKY